MLTSSERQGSFYDVDYLCESLIPPDSYYRKFREVVWPLLKDEDFSALYCQDNGRPPIPPRLLAMTLLLQFHRDLSDREMERACMYDLEVKYALCEWYRVPRGQVAEEARFAVYSNSLPR